MNTAKESPGHSPGWAARELSRLPDEAEIIAQFIGALDKHKERIKRLQQALCECSHRDFFQADMHDETCPVYVIAQEQKAASLAAGSCTSRETST